MDYQVMQDIPLNNLTILEQGEECYITLNTGTVVHAEYTNINGLVLIGSDIPINYAMVEYVKRLITIHG